MAGPGGGGLGTVTVSSRCLNVLTVFEGGTKPDKKYK